MSAKAAARAALAETVRAASTLTEKHQVTDLLPAPEPLATLFPAGGLARGSTLAVGRSSSLLVALLAAVSSGGSWCAVVGLPAFGVVAAAEAGVTVDRLALVRDPGPDPAGVVGALLDGFDLVVIGDPGVLGLAEVRRLTARARQRGSVLIGMGSWPSADLRLSLTDALWQGAGRGDGRLRQRQVTVVAEGRGSASRPRRVVVLLPTVEGRIAPLHPRPLHALPEPAAPATRPEPAAPPERTERPAPARPISPIRPTVPAASAVSAAPAVAAAPAAAGAPAAAPAAAAPASTAGGRAPAVRIRAVVPDLPGLVPASALPQPAARKRGPALPQPAARKLRAASEAG
ncbi:hypothetical protein [Cryptosporangium sp. NPDC048952]|uniref:hypothetical protein n=1 Tax=Cryptosporangium sp. NPDC048952 TaxID=3363961 RepID=UPI00371CE4D2